MLYNSYRYLHDIVLRERFCSFAIPVKRSPSMVLSSEKPAGGCLQLLSLYLTSCYLYIKAAFKTLVRLLQFTTYAEEYLV